MRWIWIDKFVEFTPRVSATAVKNVTMAEEHLHDLYPGFPIVPHSLTNYALGLTGVRLGAYTVGSLLGQLPLTIAYADLGAAGEQVFAGGADWRHQVLWPCLIGLAALLLSLLIPLVARRRLRQAASVPEAIPGA